MPRCQLADAATRQTLRVRQHAAVCAALAIDLLGTGNAWWLPELHRVRGQAVLAGQEPGDRQHGVSALRLACELAQSQHAAALWLSAAVGWASAVPPQDDGASGEVREHLQGALAAAPAMEGHALGQEARRLLATASAATAPMRDGTPGAGRADRPLPALAGAGAPATGASASIRGASPAAAAAPESQGCP